MDPPPEDDGKRKRQYWSQEDRETLLEYVTKRVDMALERTIRADVETAFRDRAIVAMLDGTGARGAELFADSKDDKRNGLRWEDVDFDERLIEVYGKSREYEQAPFPASVHDVLERLHREHEVPPPSISKGGVRRLLKRLTDEAGIDPASEYDYLTLHGARRALRRDLYTSGMSEKAQEALRHNSIETTHEAYTDVKMTDVSDSIDDVRG